MHEQDRYAITAPVADRTWEGSYLLHGNEQETGRIEIPFRQPVLIIAAYPSLSSQIPLADLPLETGQSLFIPTLDDIRIYVDISEKTRLTSRFNPSRVGNTEAGQFVTLGSYLDTTGGARVLMLDLDDNAPVIGINFQWKRDITGGPYFYDTEIALALHCKYKNPQRCC